MTRFSIEGRSFGAIAMAVLLIASAGIGAAAMVIDDPQQFNYDSNSVPDPQINADVTKDRVEMGWSPVEYEDDNGDIASLDAHLNSSNPNPITLTATDINLSEFGEFPRKNEDSNSASALDASEWTKSGANSSKLSIADTTTAPGVDAVSISTSSMAAGDTATAVYSNFSIDSDESKRVLALGGDVTTLDSGTTVEIRIVDSDSDYKNITIDSADNADNSDVLANSTGDGQVTQVKLGSLTTRSDGDGDGFDNIRKIKVVVTDGDFDGDFALVNAEKLGKYDFGERAIDDGTDDDSDKDQSETVYEPSGSYSIKSTDTMGSTFDNAELRNVQYDMIFAASDLQDSMDAKINFSEAEGYPSFDYLATIDYRLQLPDAYDLSYSNAELVVTTKLPDSRYEYAQVAEGVGDTQFEDISSWTDVTSKLSKDTEVVLDSTIQPGQQVVVEFESKHTSDEKSEMAGSTGGAMGPTGSSDDGGLLGFFTTLPGMAVAAISGFFGFRWLKG